ncbi:GNAT family N-acetyltransferase [uncultured Litoreibacter sp.]|uniref:GNAT family N-acetyltransferase n=1 Tax=uncultured Litoreibacter sp. TaxID=1392394 RepID=UPI00260DB382|nr:N-acetyltransferase [uncultured Litoreibacter sp.]
MDPSFTREAREDDHAAIDRLLEAAFGASAEVQLLHDLRAEKAIYREVIMPWGEEAAGYLAVSRFVEPEGWLCLAPVAVHPDWQGQGRGHFMVKGIVDELTKGLGRTMIVVGDGKFYRRCGFLATRAARLTSPFGTENTLLAAPEMTVPVERLVYPKAFAAQD